MPTGVRGNVRRAHRYGQLKLTFSGQFWHLWLVDADATDDYNIHIFHINLNILNGSDFTEEEMSIVTIRNLKKSYPSFELDMVSFSLVRGHITGFIGRNGAGKTTTIKSMLNMVHPDGGEIEFFGMPLQGNEAEIKQRIGYSTGTVNWYPRRKISEIADVMKSFYKNWDEELYRRYLEMFELDEEKSALELSEGMKVKCNLLFALSHGAEALILDEPTSGLDPFSRDELLELFKRLRDEGVSIFFSTHIISDIEKCADDIVYISHGKIIAAMSRGEFCNEFSQPNESLEETFLRLERGEENA